VLRIRIVGLELVAQVPVREQAHLRRKEPVPLRVDEVVHPYVVCRDILVCPGRYLRDLEVHVRGDALREALGEPGLRPLLAGPRHAVRQPLIERGEREIEQNDEGDLVLKEIVEHVRRRIVPGEDLVDGKHRPDIEIGLPPEREAELVHVPVELLEQPLETIEELMVRRVVAGEVLEHELLERGLVAVFRAPELRDLAHAAPRVGPRRLAVSRDEHRLELRDRSLHPCGRRTLRVGSVHAAQNTRNRNECANCFFS
jgi:hypothetical protein